MKTGLLTIHGIRNYGSILQAYATRQAAARLGREVQIIDYDYPNALHKSAPFAPKALLASALKAGNSFLKDRLPGRPQSTFLRRYAEARSAWLGATTMNYPSRRALLDRPPDFDTYMLGSDQSWHPRTAGRDPSFFLDFAPQGRRRVTYATSLGIASLPADLSETYASHISRFDELGIRERQGVRLVKELTGREAVLTADPTLLLDGEFWRDEAVMPPPGEPYIVCYGTNQGNDYMEKLALHLGRQAGWKVMRLNGKFHNAFDRRMHYVLDAGPREWLGYLANAQLVIGQSFHATAFAVNFRRPLIALLRGKADHDSRQVDFLDLVGLNGAALTIGDPFPDARRFLDPDFDRASSLVSEHRDRSLDYLQRALG